MSALVTLALDAAKKAGAEKPAIVAGSKPPYVVKDMATGKRYKIEVVATRLGPFFKSRVSKSSVISKALVVDFDSKLLYNADSQCLHHIVSAPGGGVKCTKCAGWFCY